MDLSRRRLLIGGGLLLAAPTIVRAASLMPIRGDRLIIDDPWPIPWPLVPEHYILKGKEVLPCKPGFEGLMQWGRFFSTNDRRVAETILSDGSYVSTVFIGLHLGSRFNGGEPFQPLVFETMVFNGPNDQKTLRHYTWDEAEAMHRDVVAFERRRLIKENNS